MYVVNKDLNEIVYLIYLKTINMDGQSKGKKLRFTNSVQIYVQN